MAKIGPIYIDEKYLNLDGPIIIWKFFLGLSRQFQDRVGDMLVAAIEPVIPDIGIKILDYKGGGLLFDSDTFVFEPEGADDIEKNYRTLSQVIVDVFPQLNGMVFDDCIFLSQDQQEEIKKNLSRLKKEG